MSILSHVRNTCALKCCHKVGISTHDSLSFGVIVAVSGVCQHNYIIQLACCCMSAILCIYCQQFNGLPACSQTSLVVRLYNREVSLCASLEGKAPSF